MARNLQSATHMHLRARAAGRSRCARGRWVRSTLLLERPVDNVHFQQHGDPLAGVPAVRLSWPTAEREPYSSRHAKVLVVGRRALLVVSANLTGAAMQSNLECGLLLRGSPHPERLCQHVQTLHARGSLVRP